MTVPPFLLLSMMQQRQQLMAMQMASNQQAAGCQSCGTQGGSGSPIVDALLGISRAAIGYAQQQQQFGLMRSLLSQPGGANPNNFLLLSALSSGGGAGFGNGLGSFGGGFSPGGLGGVAGGFNPGGWAGSGAFGV